MTTWAPDWNEIRERARRFPSAAFDFIRGGLDHTTRAIHGEIDGDAAQRAALLGDEVGGGMDGLEGSSRHVTGQQLCLGLVDYARRRYGRLALTVLRRWGVQTTYDFGVLVFALIDRGELRCAPDDRLDDFRDVCDLDEVLAPGACGETE